MKRQSATSLDLEELLRIRHMNDVDVGVTDRAPPDSVAEICQGLKLDVAGMAHDEESA